MEEIVAGFDKLSNLLSLEADKADSEGTAKGIRQAARLRIAVLKLGKIAEKFN